MFEEDIGQGETSGTVRGATPAVSIVTVGMLNFVMLNL